MWPVLLFVTSLFAQERLSIVTLGHPALRQEARELSMAEISAPATQKLIDDMVYTMKVSGGVGLAGPQVDRSFRVFVMGMGRSIPLKVVINPRLEYLTSYGTRRSYEGCLSIPGQRATVTRYQRVHLSYLDRQGRFVAEELKGMAAIIAQHEYDHLNGILILDLIDKLTESWQMVRAEDAPLM